jgi:large subunit ribosomal protein L9
MQIILLERIEKLGTIGDVVNVKDGYARNFLLPNKKALRANEANRKVFEANRARIEADNATRR